MIKKYLSLISLLYLCFPGSLFCQEIGNIKITLVDAEKSAVLYSPRLKASELEKEAAYKRMLGQKSLLYPKLSIEGYYRYQTSVPELDLPIPGLGPKKLGDNNNYSIGPTLLWTLWDWNGLKNSYSSVRSYAESKKYESEGVKRQIILSLRSAYFQLAYAGEQVVLLTDALKLSKEQYEDIEINYRAGAKSKMDKLSAHQEFLLRQKQLNSARLGMASAFRDISSLMGTPFDENICNPIDCRVSSQFNLYITTPTVIIEIDPIDTLIQRFKPFLKAVVWEEHPQLEVFNELARSAEFTSRSASSGYWPKFQVSARSSIEYPNFSKPESYNQNTFGASVNWALFEAGASKDRAQENEKMKESYIERKNALYSDFKRDWTKTMDTLSSLDEQYTLSLLSVQEAEELAQIAYRSYTSGSLTYLELQNANYKALEAKIELAKIKVEMLLNMAILSSLAQ